MDIIERVLQSEGGFVNHPADKGGATNFGITAARLGEWRKLGRPAAAAEVQALTRDEARQIYQAWYVTQPKFDRISDDYLRTVVVDSGVLYGTGRAARWLQEALGVTADGVIGQQTLAALTAQNPGTVARRVLALRVKRIGQVVSADPSQLVFLAGWLNRTADLLAEA
ncbi:glycoside hydrolase family 108 protein [Oleisolibacter albus]|uniref:glycoside hydrolase family 108 protein n=1 Tax=Oleisolibacter albus TaxID=2171757 RepID=UPI000DF29F13|nr:glycosyl hydrolase 108 family protein [Oleisolibacter albus]